MEERKHTDCPGRVFIMPPPRHPVRRQCVVVLRCWSPIGQDLGSHPACVTGHADGFPVRNTSPGPERMPDGAVGGTPRPITDTAPSLVALGPGLGPAIACCRSDLTRRSALSPPRAATACSPRPLLPRAVWAVGSGQKAVDSDSSSHWLSLAQVSRRPSFS